MTSSSERRRAPRALADFPISLSPAEGAAPARLKDLSTIGLCCTTAQEMPEMTVVGIDLQLPGSAASHKVQGAIVRCDPIQDDGFEVAVYFTEIGNEAKHAVGAYVAQAQPA